VTRDLEPSLWRHVASGKHARDWIVAALADGRINAAKQAYRTLEKWASKGLYDYGVALDMGWLVPLNDRPGMPQYYTIA
jgi:hypothetical protein